MIEWDSPDKFVGTTAAIIALAAAGASAGASVYSANKQAGAAKEAAATQSKALETSTTTQTDAAKYAADLQQKQAQEALQFTRQQAETDWRNQELARQANYDQWRSREGRVSDFGQQVGLPGRSIPAYAAGIDPNYTGGGGPATLAGAAAQPPSQGGFQMPTVDPANPRAGIVAGLTAAYGPNFDPSQVDYYLQKWPELTARGQQLGNPNYAVQRLLGMDAGGADAASYGPYAGGTASAAPTQGNRYTTMAQAALPYRTPTVTPALQLPGTLAGLVR